MDCPFNRAHIILIDASGFQGLPNLSAGIGLGLDIDGICAIPAFIRPFLFSLSLASSLAYFPISPSVRPDSGRRLP